MNIQITQTYAKIGIEATPAKINTETTYAQLRLHHTDAKIQLHNEFPRVEISNRECFNTSGLKDLESFMKEAAQLGYSAAMKYIAKTAGDGDAYAAIESGSNPMPSIVERDAYPQHEFNIDYIPKAKPQINVKGEVQTSSPGALGGANIGVEGEFIPGRVSYNVTPYNVKIYLTQKASLNISFVGSNVDVYK